jgi:hypothetical protein
MLAFQRQKWSCREQVIAKWGTQSLPPKAFSTSEQTPPMPSRVLVRRWGLTVVWSCENGSARQEWRLRITRWNALASRNKKTVLEYGNVKIYEVDGTIQGDENLDVQCGWSNADELRCLGMGQQRA